MIKNYIIISLILLGIRSNCFAEKDNIESFLETIDSSVAALVLGKVKNQVVVKHILFDNASASKAFKSLRDDKEMVDLLSKNDQLFVVFKRFEKQPVKVFDIVEGNVVFGMNKKIALAKLKNHFHHQFRDK